MGVVVPDGATDAAAAAQLSSPASRSICRAAHGLTGTAPAAMRARNSSGVTHRWSATSDGSAKPAEVAKALGVWGSDDPRAQHALVARLGVVKAADRGQVPRRVASLPVVADA